MTIEIRPTSTSEHELVIDVVRAAFGGEAHEEIRICRDVWSSGGLLPDLDLVAVDADLIVGHVLGSRGDLSGRGVVAVAPLSVLPDHQKQGIGTRLMNELLRTADQAGWPLALLIGDPNYYRRFDFEPAHPLGITSGPQDDGAAPYQVRRLSSYDPSWRGHFRYVWELKS